jgi:hypothetical protein
LKLLGALVPGFCENRLKFDFQNNTFVEDSSNVCRRYHAVSTRLAKKGRKRKVTVISQNTGKDN